MGGRAAAQRRRPPRPASTPTSARAIAALAAAGAPGGRRDRPTLRGAAKGPSVRRPPSQARLPVVEGELRDSYGYTWDAPGHACRPRSTEATGNALAERLLVRDVEAMDRSRDGRAARPPRGARSCAPHGRTLPPCSPATIHCCGTSIDAVAEAFDARVSPPPKRRRSVCARRRAGWALIGHDRERARVASSGGWRPVVVLRNAGGRAPRRRGSWNWTLTRHDRGCRGWSRFSGSDRENRNGFRLGACQDMAASGSSKRP